MPRVLVTDRIGEEGLALLREKLDVDVMLGMTPEELLDVIPNYEALAVRSETKVTAEVLEGCQEPRRRRPRRGRRRQHQR